MNLLEVISTVPAVMERPASLALDWKVARPAVLVKVEEEDQFWGPDWVKVPELVMLPSALRVPPLVKVPELVKAPPGEMVKTSPGPPDMVPALLREEKMLTEGSER